MSWEFLLTSFVVVPRLNVRNGLAPTATSKLPAVYPVGTEAPVEHVTPFATTFALFEDTSPVPVTCTTHDAVIGQSMSCVNGPFSVKTPTSNEKSAFAPGLWLQQSRYRAPDVPSVVSAVATA